MRTEISPSSLMWPLFPRYEGPNKKGVKSRKGLSWDFFLARPLRSHLSLCTFPCVPKIKQGKRDCVGRVSIVKELSVWLTRHPNKHGPVTLRAPRCVCQRFGWGLLMKRATGIIGVIYCTVCVWVCATHGMSPSSGGHVSLPPGRSAAVECQASITSEKAPCGDKWGKERHQKTWE